MNNNYFPVPLFVSSVSESPPRIPVIKLISCGVVTPRNKLPYWSLGGHEARQSDYLHPYLTPIRHIYNVLLITEEEEGLETCHFHALSTQGRRGGVEG